MPSSALDAAFSLVVGALVVALLAAWGTSIVWAHRDAARRGRHPVLVAALVGLVSWPLGVLVWLLVRPDD